jgi:predicted NACHT family NTPase
VDRLSLLEQQILAWLGLEREPATFGQLVADLGARAGRSALLEAVEGLRRRSLIERTPGGPAFTLQSVVLEYVTDRLLERATDEIERGQFALLKAHALMKAQAKDYVRGSQERLLIAPLLERLVARYSTRDARLLGHTGQVYGVALSADGHLIASSSFDGTIRIWHLEEEGGTLQASLEGHTAAPMGVAMSESGGVVASGGYDGSVRVWDAEASTLLMTLEGHTGGVRSVALARDGGRIATGGFDRTVRLWQTESGRPLMTMTGHTGGVWSVALSGSGALLASGSADGTVRLWETSTGVCLRTLRGDRRYERLDITGLTGVTEAQRQAMLALGAVERTGVQAAGGESHKPRQG